jgi:hypothetical protein
MDTTLLPSNITTIVYDTLEEISNEFNVYNYNMNKDSGEWLDAKKIVSNTNSQPEYLWDILNAEFNTNNDSFENIQKVYYHGLIDNENVVREFSTEIAKYIIENIKINQYKASGYIFSTDPNVNKWDFSIVIVSSKSIYCANRYMNDTTLGYF